MGAEYRRMINEAIEAETVDPYEVREICLRDLEELFTWEDTEPYNDDELL